MLTAKKKFELGMAKLEDYFSGSPYGVKSWFEEHYPLIDFSALVQLQEMIEWRNGGEKVKAGMSLLALTDFSTSGKKDIDVKKETSRWIDGMLNGKSVAFECVLLSLGLSNTKVSYVKKAVMTLLGVVESSRVDDAKEAVACLVTSYRG